MTLAYYCEPMALCNSHLVLEILKRRRKRRAVLADSVYCKDRVGPGGSCASTLYVCCSGFCRNCRSQVVSCASLPPAGSFSHRENRVYSRIQLFNNKLLSRLVPYRRLSRTREQLVRGGKSLACLTQVFVTRCSLACALGPEKSTIGRQYGTIATIVKPRFIFGNPAFGCQSMHKCAFFFPLRQKKKRKLTVAPSTTVSCALLKCCSLSTVTIVKLLLVRRSSSDDNAPGANALTWVLNKITARPLLLVMFGVARFACVAVRVRCIVSSNLCRTCWSQDEVVEILFSAGPLRSRCLGVWQISVSCLSRVPLFHAEHCLHETSGVQ